MALTSSPSVELRGAQEPRLSHFPESVSSSGAEAIELAAMAGLELDPWQQLVLMRMLAERADGKWAAFEFGLVVPRQNGKGSVLEARELAGLFLLGEELLIHSAHEQLTATNHFYRLLNLIEEVPEFDRRVLKAVRGKGAEAIKLRGGQEILFKTRTGDGGRGLTGDFVALDEAMILRAATMAALVPTMAARSMVGNPQLVYAGSAVDQDKHEHGVILARLRERALACDPRVGYMEWSVDGDDPDKVPPEVRHGPAARAQANPGYEIRISDEFISNEAAGALGPREFAVERLGVGDWPDTSQEAGRVISREAWAACPEHNPANRVTGVPMFALDSNMDGTWASLGVAGLRDDALPQIALVRHERGTDWVVDACVALKAKHRRMRLVVDKGGPAAHLIPALKLAGIRLVVTSMEEYAASCADFVAAVNETAVRYPFPQPELDDAIANARRAPLGDRWKWSRKDSAGADISPLVSVTLALWGLRNGKARSRLVSLN